MPPRHLYVHVPFCTRRCSYCDFSIAVRRQTPVDEYVDALARELDLVARNSEPWELDTVYLGGGTPSRLGAGVARVLDAVRSRAHIADDAEVTIEANPEDVTPEAARHWKSAGVTRLSIGAQSFDDTVLAWMHRVHDSARIHEAYANARAAGFANISIDLIFALPEELPRDWAGDLRKVIDLGPEHVSLYGLTNEPKTPYARWHARGLLREAGDDRYATEFLAAHDALAAAGYAHYEVSNFAKPNRRSRHNSSYWTLDPYQGIGPSAHSFDGERRWWNVRAYAEWVRLLRAGKSVVDGVEVLDEVNVANERVYLGLRTQNGLTLHGAERSVAAGWESQGWADVTAEKVTLTPQGWLLLDSLAGSLTSIPSGSYVRDHAHT